MQDVLWINYQLTGRQQAFRYAALEGATYQQYGYGQSQEVLAQAGRLFKALSTQGGLDAGNTATAFVATVAYLALNGYSVTEPDGGALASTLASGSADWGKLAQRAEHAHGVSVPEAARQALAAFPATCERLLERP